MVSLIATCGDCGFENPRGWVACARCGHLLGPILRGVPQFGTTITTTRKAPLPGKAGLPADGDAPTDVFQPDEMGGDVRPLLGQVEALRAVRRGVTQAFSEGRASLVLLKGEPGAGKTRLLQRASEIAAQRAVDVRVMYAPCRPDDDGKYAPFSALMRMRFGIAPASAPTIVRGQMATAVAQVLGARDAARVAETTHLLGNLAGVPFPASPFLRGLSDPGELHAAMKSALQHFVFGDGQNRPLLILLDDMGAADPQAWDLLEGLLQVEAPVAIVVAGTPDMDTETKSLVASSHAAHESIVPLSAGDVEGVVNALVPGLSSVPQTLVSALRHRTKGNPKAVHDMLESLQDGGLFIGDDRGVHVDLQKLEQGDLPLTMEDAVKARIATLDPDAHAVMRHAAIVGERFWDGALLALMHAEAPSTPLIEPVKVWQSMTDETRLSEILEVLQNRRMIVRIAASNRSGHNEFTFNHSGMRAALYDEVQDQERRAAHAIVAGWLAMTPDLEVEDLTGVLAPQLEHAGLDDRAGRAYLEAATLERQRMRTTMALRYSTKALALLDRDDTKSVIEALHMRGSLLTTLGRYDEAYEAFSEVLQRAWRVGARGSGGAALNRLARIHRQRGEHKLAIEHLKAALLLFRAADDQRGVASTFDDLAQVNRLRGNLDMALSAAKEALEIRVSIKDKRGQAVSLNTIGYIQLDRGDFDTANTRFRTALKIRQSIDDHEGEVQTGIALGRLAFYRGRLAEAISTYEAALESAREMDNRRFQSYLLTHLGEAYLASDRLDEATEALTAGKALAREMRDQRVLADIERNLGLLALRRGDDQAEATLLGALVMAQDYGSSESIALAHRCIGRLKARTLFDATGKAVHGAEESFRECIRVFRESGNRHEVARTEAELGYHLIERGERDAAKGLLRSAYDTMHRLHLPESDRVRQTIGEL